jgi:hypothetical protein
MLEGAHPTIAGRCPTCSQLVALNDAARSQFVQCPKCTHQAIGAVFIDIETPQPVVMLPLDAQLGRLDTEPPLAHPGYASSQLATRLRVPQEERTHIVLEPVSADETPERTVELRVPEGVGGSGASSGAGADEARTHLLLDASDVQEERAPPGPARVRLHSAGQGLHGVAQHVEALLHGRQRASLLALGVVCGIAAPLFDFLVDSSAATRLGSFVFLLAMGVLALAWLGRLRPEGASLTRTASARLRAQLRLFAEDVQELGRSPRYLKLIIAAELIGVLGVLGLSVASLRSVARLLFGLDDLPTALRWLCGVALVAAIVALSRASKLVPVAAPDPEDLNESMVAARKLPAIVDLSDPLPSSFIGEYTPLHRVLMVLSEWRAPAWPDEVGCKAALVRHFQRHLTGSRVERDKQLGRSPREGVADIVVDDLVLIVVRRGLQKAQADAAITELDLLGRRWQERPMILVVFDAPREQVFEGSATSALRELHRRLPMLTARLPTLERSAAR